MARKVYCEDTTCKYHKSGGVCSAKRINIFYRGRCDTWERGFMYYIELVKELLDTSNFIPMWNISEDVRIGLFYVLKIFHLGFCEHEWGSERFITLYALDDKERKALKWEDIRHMELDHEILNEQAVNFNNGILPNKNIQKDPPKKASQPFGWLSPTGEFTEGDFGEHEAMAMNLIKKMGLKEEYFQGTTLENHYAGDFLTNRGWCLIHNPSGYGGYIVSHTKPLTKKQKDFLFTYFIEMGDEFKANQFVED